MKPKQHPLAPLYKRAMKVANEYIKQDSILSPEYFTQVVADIYMKAKLETQINATIGCSKNRKKVQKAK